MNVEHLVEWDLMGETEVYEANPTRGHFVTY
jgi:hypothetical protein